MTSPHPSADPPPRQPFTAAPPRRLFRDPHGPIGGVASGFAEYFEVDPVIVRLLWVVALLSGIGLPAYVLCWLIVPKANTWPPPSYPERAPSAAAPQRATWLSGIVIIALCAMIASGFDGIGNYLLPAALVGFGIYLLNQRPSRTTPEGGAAEAGGPDADLGSEGNLGGAVGTPSARGIVTPTVLSLLGIGAGALVALGAAGVVHVSIATAAGIGLAIVGAGLVASLWLGRAPGLVPVGLGLALVLLSASTLEGWVGKGHSEREPRGIHAQAEINGEQLTGIGERKYVVTSLDELQSRYEVGIGSVVLDLSQLDLSGQERSVALEVGLGKVSVIAPRGAVVEVRGELGAGKSSVFEHADEGVDLNIDENDTGTGAGTLRLNIQIGLGEAQVRRNPA